MAPGAQPGDRAAIRRPIDTGAAAPARAASTATWLSAGRAATGLVARGWWAKSRRRAFREAVKRAGIENFTFHDLRHTAINNWRQAGHDYLRIMAVSGHKTMSVFKRYNTVTREEIFSLVRQAE